MRAIMLNVRGQSKAAVRQSREVPCLITDIAELPPINSPINPSVSRRRAVCAGPRIGAAEQRSGRRIRARRCLSATQWSEFGETPPAASSAGKSP